VTGGIFKRPLSLFFYCCCYWLLLYEKAIVVAPNAVFRGEEEGSIHIGGIRKQEVKLTTHVITFAMINSDS
jgi:hypothetical protein